MRKIRRRHITDRQISSASGVDWFVQLEDVTASDSAATAPSPPGLASFARVTSRWAIKMNGSHMKANFNGK
jgi:hypothetical protein